MRPSYRLCAAAFLVLAAVPARAQRAPAEAQATFARLSDGVAFVKNRGQWNDEVLFLARLGGADAWVTRDGVVFDFYEVERGAQDPNALPHERPEAMRRGHVIAMRFEGGRARRAEGRGLREAYHNYFVGADPSRWASRVPLYDEVVLEGLYDGVDLRLYSEDGFLRYDLAVAPGADPSQVRMRMEGAEGVAVTAEGALSVGTALGAVEHRGLFAYQEGARGREAVASAFRVATDGAVGFEVRGADPSRALVIDPLIWATFLGSGDSDAALSVDVGADGSAYVVGYTTSRGFPTTPGAYDTTCSCGGGSDAFVTRLSPDGSDLVWSTFLGGERDERAYGVIVGADGSTFVAGETRSSSFPTTPDAFDTSYNGAFSYYDAFVTRLSPDGSALLYSTFLGGAKNDYASELGVGADGSAFVVGDTQSGDFPVTAGAYDISFNGATDLYDGFVTRLSPDGSALVYATFLGGTDNDGVRGISVGGESVLVAGYTRGAGFPATFGAFDNSHNGDYDGFVTRLSADGSDVLWSTFLGGAAYDRAWGVAVGPDGSAFVTGAADSPNFPVTPGAFDTSFNDGEPGSGDAFVARLSSDGRTLRYSTFLGGPFRDIAYVVRVGVDGSAVSVGQTRSARFPVTPGAFDTSYNGDYDAFVTRLSPDGGTLLYGTFLGGPRFDDGHGIALSADGSAVVAGETASRGFPVTPGAYDEVHNEGGTDGFVARLDVGLGLDCPLSFNSASITPLTVAPGDAFTVAVDVANGGPTPRHAHLVIHYDHDSGGPSGTLTLGSDTVPVTSGVSASVSQRVPADAPGGSYALDLELVDGQTGEVCDARPFTLTVQGAHMASASGNARFEGAEAVHLFAEGTDGAATAAVAPGAVSVWPNPASGRAAVAFSLDASAAVHLALYDVLGREVSSLDAGTLGAGAHRLPLDFSALPAGAYVWRLEAAGKVTTGQVTLVR